MVDCFAFVSTLESEYCHLHVEFHSRFKQKLQLYVEGTVYQRCPVQDQAHTGIFFKVGFEILVGFCGTDT